MEDPEEVYDRRRTSRSDYSRRSRDIQLNEDPNAIDANGDGQIDPDEVRLYEMRAKNRRKMAWVSLISIIATAAILIFYVPDERLDRLNNILELYWIALGGVVGAYVGISAWSRRG